MYIYRQRLTIINLTGISQDARYVPPESNYQHILDGTLVPGISFPETTPTTLTSRQTSHKTAEQGRRNRINDALKELEELLPPAFIQDQKAQKPGRSSVNAGDNEKCSTQVFGKAFVVETAVQYIKKLRKCTKGSDTSAEIDAPASLSSESDLRKISERGPRNRSTPR
jgi:hypothetical protein